MIREIPVVVFGDYISAYGVIKGLSTYKIPMYMVSKNGKGIAAKSIFIKKLLLLSPEDPNFITKLDDWINKKVGPTAVLMVAGDDNYLDVLSKRYKELSGDIKITFPDWDTVKLLREKRRTYKLAEDIGVPIPKTYYITSQRKLEELLNNNEVVLNYPFFMKAENSSELLEQYGIKGVICNNDSELLKNYKNYGGFGGELLLQELIYSKNEKIMTVLMALNRRSQPIGLLINEKKRSSRQFMSGTLVVSAWSDELLEYSLKLVKKIGYYGYAGIQFKFDSQEYQYKLMEINGRISMSNSLALRCGVNLPYLMYQEAIEEPLQELKEFRQEYPDKIIWWYMVSDIVSYFRWNRKYIKFIDYIKSLIGRGYIIEPFYWRDPYPGLLSLVSPLLILFKKIKSKSLKK